MSKLTLEEIAALVGVSRSTVSRAINNQPRVSAEVRERVQRIMAHTGYAPNIAAQLLAQRRQPFIAVVVTEPLETLFGNRDLAARMADVAAACQANNCLYALYLLNSTELSPALHTPQVAGVIVVGGPTTGEQTDRVVSQLQAHRLPFSVLAPDRPAQQADLIVSIRNFLQSHAASLA